MTSTPAATPAVRVKMLMGLPFSLHVRDMSGPAADAAADRIWSALSADERTFSTYRSDSEISRMSAGSLPAALASVAVREVLGLAEEARERTGGVFDIRGAGRLDPSGVVKGWAAERAFAAAGVTDGYLNAGGDLVLAGPPGSWRIGIEHPADPRGLLTVVALGSGGIATSGRAHRGAHLWDPATGRPAAGSWQATVVGPTLTWADILATAAAVAGPARLDRSGWPPGYHVLLAGPDGTAYASEGFTDLVAPDIRPLRVVALP